MARQDFPGLDALAAAQEQIVARSQLRSLGIDRFRVRNHVAAGRWHTVGDRLVVLHTGALTKRQQWWAALLHAGPGAALCHRTGAEAAGLRGWESELVHVAVAPGRRPPALSGVRYHELQGLPPLVHPVATPSRLRTPVCLVRAAANELRAEHGCALLAAGVQQRLVPAAALVAELEQAGRIRHVRLLRAAAHDIAGGAHALSEIDFARLCRCAGLPEPERQVVRRDSNGRRRYLDAVFLRVDASRLVVEIDGALHLQTRSWWDDMVRANELVIDGAHVLRFPSALVRARPEVVIDQLRRALGITLPDRAS